MTFKEYTKKRQAETQERKAREKEIREAAAEIAGELSVPVPKFPLPIKADIKTFESQWQFWLKHKPNKGRGPKGSSPLILRTGFRNC